MTLREYIFPRTISSYLWSLRYRIGAFFMLVSAFQLYFEPLVNSFIQGEVAQREYALSIVTILYLMLPFLAGLGLILFKKHARIMYYTLGAFMASLLIMPYVGLKKTPLLDIARYISWQGLIIFCAAVVLLAVGYLEKYKNKSHDIQKVIDITLGLFFILTGIRELLLVYKLTGSVKSFGLIFAILPPHITETLDTAHIGIIITYSLFILTGIMLLIPKLKQAGRIFSSILLLSIFGFLAALNIKLFGWQRIFTFKLLALCICYEGMMLSRKVTNLEPQ